MRTLLIVIYLLFFFILGLPVLAVDWLIRKRYPEFSAHAQLRIVQWAFRCICFMAGLKLTVIGEENVPKDEAVLYIGNHRGFFDIVVTYMLCPRLTGYIAKSGINKVPVLRVIMGRLYCLFLDRDDIKQGLQVILKAIDYVKNGISICIFPEGRIQITSTRSLCCPSRMAPSRLHKKPGAPSFLWQLLELPMCLKIICPGLKVPRSLWSTENRFA